MPSACGCAKRSSSSRSGCRQSNGAPSRRKAGWSARSSGCGIGRDDEQANRKGGEMNNSQGFVLMIVAIVMLAGIFKARIRYGHKYRGQESGDESRAARAEAERLREEVKQLKE